MNDLERRLKDLLETDAAKAPTVPRDPDTVRPRVRRRQVGTALVGAFMVVALVAVSFAGVQLIDRTERAPRPADDTWAGYEIFERTAAVNGFEISSPSDWYLVRPVPEAGCIARSDCGSIPILQLSNFDPGLAHPACAEPVPAGGVVLAIELEVAVGPETALDDVPTLPVAFDRGTPVTDGPCGRGRYLPFKVEGARYVAWIGAADGVSDDEVDEAIRSFDGMRGRRPGHIDVGGDPRHAAYVIAGGVNAAGPWRLEARPSLRTEPPSNVELLLVGPYGGPAIEGFNVPEVVIEQAGTDPIFGAVTKASDRVDLVSTAGTADARIVPLPPSLPFDIDLFFGSPEGGTPVRAVGFGADGERLQGPAVEVPTADLIVSGDRVVARFRAFGSTWGLVVSRGNRPCGVGLQEIESGFGGGADSNCGSIVGQGHSGERSSFFFYGSLTGGAVTADIVTADGRRFPAVAVGSAPDGRGFFVVAVEGSGPGTVRTIDGEGNVVTRWRATWDDYGQVI